VDDIFLDKPLEFRRLFFPELSYVVVVC